MDLLLPLLLGDLHGLVLGETAAEVASELGAEVKRKVFLVLVEQTQLGALVGVDNSQDAGDRLADVAAVWRKSRQLSGSLSVLLFPVLRLFRCLPPFHHFSLPIANCSSAYKRKGKTHILWVLVEAPPAIF